jgi:hypothetical protein
LGKRSLIRKFYEFDSFLDVSPIEDLILYDDSLFSEKATNSLIQLLFRLGSCENNHRVMLRVKEHWRSKPDSVNLNVLLPYFLSPSK